MIRVVTWLVCLFAVAMGAYGFRLSAQARSLSHVLEAKKAELQHAAEREHHKKQLQQQTRRLAVLQDRFVRQLGTLLRDCESRDDFIIREGPWIAVSRLKKGDGRGFRLAFYLPEGRHVLKYATESLYRDRLNGIPGTDHEPAVPDDMIAVELDGCSEVFELQVMVKDGMAATTMRLQVLGKQNAAIVDRTFTFPRYTMLSRCIIDDRSCYLAYPGELAKVGYDFLVRHEARLDLLSTRAIGAEPPRPWIWIESEDLPCISAVTAACHFDRYPTHGGSDEPYYAQMRIDEFFKPYDHSGRHFLRSDVLRWGPTRSSFGN